MKKFIISNEEKNAILESHNSYRNVLMGHLFNKSLVLEQPQNPTTPQEVLSMAKGDGTTPGKCAFLKNAIDSTRDGKPALVFKPTAEKKDEVNNIVKWTTGDNVYFYGDMTYETIYVNPETQQPTIRYSNTWRCKDLNVVQADLDVKINSLINDFKWKKYDGLTDAEKNIATTPNQTSFEVMYAGTTPLYRAIYGQQRGAITDPQKNYSTKIFGSKNADAKEGVDWTFEKDIEFDEKEVWYRYDKTTIPNLGKDKGIFDEDMAVYLNPTGSLAKGRTAQTKARTTEQNITKDDCEEIVENFYNAFHLQTRMTGAEIEQSKTDVQWCARKFYKNWGVSLKAGKLNNYIDILKGLANDTNGYPMPRSSKFNIN